MRELLQAAAEAGSGTVVCSAYPRLVDGKPSKNPRYLQIRPDLLAPRGPLRRRARHAPGAGDHRPRAAADAGRRRADRPAQQPARPPGGDPAAGRLRPDPLPGAARAVHGLHLLADRQEPVDDGRRLGGGADQGPVQRPADDRRPQRRPGVLHPHRAGGLLARPPGTSGPHRRVDHDISLLDPGDLVPAAPPGSATRRS